MTTAEKVTAAEEAVLEALSKIAGLRESTRRAFVDTLSVWIDEKMNAGRLVGDAAVAREPSRIARLERDEIGQKAHVSIREELRNESQWLNAAAVVLDCDIDRVAQKAAELRAWNQVAVDSNRAIEVYLRTVPGMALSAHYGMPVDGVRKVVQSLQRQLDDVLEQHRQIGEMVHRDTESDETLSDVVRQKMARLAEVTQALNREQTTRRVADEQRAKEVADIVGVLEGPLKQGASIAESVRESIERAKGWLDTKHPGRSLRVVADAAAGIRKSMERGTPQFDDVTRAIGALLGAAASLSSDG